MGTLTYTEMQGEVRAAMGGRTDQDTRIPVALNLAQQQLARAKMNRDGKLIPVDWEELQFADTLTIPYTGVAATDRIINFTSMTTTNPREIWSIVIDNGSLSSKLQAVPTRQMDQMIPDPDFWSTRQPRWYVKWKERIELFPVPDAAYSGPIRGLKWPDALSAGGGTSNFKEKDDILIFLATGYIYDLLGDTAKAENFLKRAATQIETALAEDINSPDDVILPPWENNSRLGGTQYWTNPAIFENP